MLVTKDEPMAATKEVRCNLRLREAVESQPVVYESSGADGHLVNLSW
jgi:hypothetical protein